MFRRINSRYCLRFSLWLLCAHSVAFVHAEPLGVNSTVTGDQVIAAQQARLAIEATDEQLSVVMHRLESALDEAIRRVPEHLTESDFRSERDAILLLDKLMAKLIEQSDSVLAAQQEYLALGKKYREELTNARPTFEAAAKQFRICGQREVRHLPPRRPEYGWRHGRVGRPVREASSRFQRDGAGCCGTLSLLAGRPPSPRAVSKRARGNSRP